MAISLQRHIVSDISCSSLETKREILVVQVVGRVVLENNYKSMSTNTNRYKYKSMSIKIILQLPTIQNL